MDLPPDVELMSDIAAAEWVIQGLRPWGRGRAPVVTSVVPKGFETFARIPHSAEPRPMEGELPPAQMEALVGVLSGFTSRPDRCWFCVWSGYGFWWTGANVLLSPSDDPRGERAAEYSRRAEELDRVMRATPRVEAEGRDYFLFRGPLSVAHSLEFDGWDQPPNLWWPDDRAWCVGTDIDMSSTYVGGSRDCIQRVTTAPELNATEVKPGDDLR